MSCRTEGRLHHVIVGNSVAGIEAAITLRNRDADARISVVSAEHPHFFARTALMYVFCGQLSLRDTEPYDHALYERMRFERVQDRVVRVRPDARALDLASGGTLSYDTLLLAVGSVARPLPWAPPGDPGVHHFVTLADLQKLDAAAKPGQVAAVVGGGLIGVEVAEVLQQRGLRVNFLVREPWYFPVALDAREAEVVAAHIRAHGVDVRLGATVSAMTRTPDGTGGGVAGGPPPAPGRITLDLAGERLDVDLVVGAIGVIPNTAFLRESGIPLSAEGAVETDDALRAGAPDVWAAGDCANVTWIDGSRRPEQLWYTARDQGRAAARSMLGDNVTYRRGTWYNSAKFFDIEYTTAGFLPYPSGSGVAMQACTPPGYRTWFQHVPGTAVTQRIVCRGDRVVGFNCLGSRWDHAVFLRWIHERRSLEFVLARMEEARFDEELTGFAGGRSFRVLPTATITEG